MIGAVNSYMNSCSMPFLRKAKITRHASFLIGRAISCQWRHRKSFGIAEMLEPAKLLNLGPGSVMGEGPTPTLMASLRHICSTGHPDATVWFAPGDSVGTYPMESCKGLSSADAQQRLTQYGPNAAVEEKPKTWRLFLHKFWAPVPWMLEITPVLEALPGKWTEAVIITLPLIFYGILGFSQERRVLLICSRSDCGFWHRFAATGSGRA